MRHLIFALGVAVLALVLINQCWAGDLPTEEEVWELVTSERFGPIIGAEPPDSAAGLRLTSIGYFNERYVEDFELADDGRIYVTYREPSNAIYAVNPPRPVPDTIYRDVYGVKDGRIVFLGRQQGRVVPEKVEPERWEFEEFCEDCE